VHKLGEKLTAPLIASSFLLVFDGSAGNSECRGKGRMRSCYVTMGVNENVKKAVMLFVVEEIYGNWYQSG
jgi:hypothetical protein